MAVHLEGGQTDWQLDTENLIHPSMDRIHATILLALDTSWQGGDLVLRRGGREMRVDIHPLSKWSDPTSTHIDLLYPDTRYKVESVTKDVRMLLHFDVVSGEPWAESGSSGPEVYEDADTYDNEEERQHVDALRRFLPAQQRRPVPAHMHSILNTLPGTHPNGFRSPPCWQSHRTHN
jgi:hypothetical protein